MSEISASQLNGQSYLKNNTTMSINTTYMIKDNSKLDNFGGVGSEKSFVNIMNAVREYESVLTEIEDTYKLKEEIRLQGGEIEKLNAENNDYVLKIITLVRDRDEIMYQTQFADTQVAEEKIMLQKLLKTVKDATKASDDNKTQEEAINLAKYELFDQKNVFETQFNKKAAVGAMGKYDRLKQEQSFDKCGTCCFESENDNKTNKNDQDNKVNQNEDTEGDADTIGVDTTSVRLRTLEARIKSLLLERDGMSALLTRRIQSLDASMLRLKATLQQRLEDTNKLLDQNSRELVLTTRLKTEADARTCKLESDTALMAAKGNTVSKEARKTKDDAKRGVRREFKIFEIGREREIMKEQEESQRAHEAQMKKLDKELIYINSKNEELEMQIEREKERIEQNEKKVRKLGNENGKIRELIETVL